VQPTSETVVGAILLRKTKSLGRYDTWTAVITNYRLIFAQLTEQMAKDATLQARDQAKAEGKGALGQWGSQLKSAFTYSQRYLAMSPNAALAETPGNFALDNAGISEIKLHLKDHHSGSAAYENEFKIEFKSAQGTLDFRMDENTNSVNLLKSIYGNRVKMPFGYIAAGTGGSGVNVGFRVHL
jgi:hypothetical protein